tara:strand:- start:2308 stop:3039 length:732 start_codon:yes stop_codon:yes gene_type:complete
MFSCDSDKSSETAKKNIDAVVFETIEQRITRHIEANLKIPATEKYTYQIFKGEINGDDSLDFIITVNRLDFAINEAIERKRMAKSASSGFMGTFNFIFYMNGDTKNISTAIPIPSSAKGKLKVSFEHLRSDSFNDFMVDFKLDNASFRRFFTLYDEQPREIFEIMLYDGLGDIENHAISIEYSQGSYSLVKDILIFTGELEKVKFDDPEKVYSYNPEIKKTDLLERRWFFNSNQRKYYTKKDQ